MRDGRRLQSCIECFGRLPHSESVGLLFSICIFFAAAAAVVATENERFCTNDIRFQFQNAIRTQKALLQMLTNTANLSTNTKTGSHTSLRPPRNDYGVGVIFYLLADNFQIRKCLCVSILYT